MDLRNKRGAKESEKAKRDREDFGGLTKFERGLLNSWLLNMGLDPNKMSRETKIEYSKYVVFQMLIMKVRNDKKESRTYAYALKNFFKYVFPKALAMAFAIAFFASVIVGYGLFVYSYGR